MSENFKLKDSHKQRIAAELKYQFSRSSGPGGQKVNKTESRVELMWKIDESVSFKDEQKSLLIRKLSHRISRQGVLIFYSDRYRSREQNKEHCLRKLFAAIELSENERRRRRERKEKTR